MSHPLTQHYAQQRYGNAVKQQMSGLHNATSIRKIRELLIFDEDSNPEDEVRGSFPPPPLAFLPDRISRSLTLSAEGSGHLTKAQPARQFQSDSETFQPNNQHTRKPTATDPLRIRHQGLIQRRRDVSTARLTSYTPSPAQSKRMIDSLINEPYQQQQSPHPHRKANHLPLDIYNEVAQTKHPRRPIIGPAIESARQSRSSPTTSTSLSPFLLLFSAPAGRPV